MYCDQCDYLTGDPSLLKRHIKSVHEKVKQGVSPPMICSFNEIKEKEAKKHNIDNIGCQEILVYAR